MLWGGLRPIPRQVVVDVVTLMGMAQSTWTMARVRAVGIGSHTGSSSAVQVQRSTLVLMMTGFWIFLSTDNSLTNRWALTIPWFGVAILHLLHRLLLRRARRLSQTATANTDSTVKSKSEHGGSRYRYAWLHWILTILCALCIALSAALCILFPAVELPLVDGPFAVGAIDFFIPLEYTIVDTALTVNATETCSVDATDAVNLATLCERPTNVNVPQLFVPARLLYPTSQSQKPRIASSALWPIFDGVPYLNPSTVLEFCRHSMHYAAPPPLNRWGWILHTWRLIQLPLQQSAPLLSTVDSSSATAVYPLVVYSHGLGGTLDLYSYQAMMLASHGSLVLSLTHTDGTAPVVPQPDNRDPVRHNRQVLALWQQGLTVDYARARRRQTEHRVREFIAATELLLQLTMPAVGESKNDSHPEWHEPLDNLRSMLTNVQINHTTFIGHSHGGVTALTAANRRPDLVQAVVAHEPAMDWAPDDCRRSLFQSKRILQDSTLPLQYDGGTGNFEVPGTDANHSSSIHDLDLLIMNSNQWAEKGWGSVALFETLFHHGHIGRPNGHSRHVVVANATHNEFSDTSMLTPLWLARPIVLAGPRSPIDTAAEIAEHTRLFLDKVQRPLV
jgi:pimeloyl-ACP methyl ester carboxylesterase